MWQNTERLANTMATDFSKKCEILAELWMNFRDESEMEDFITYNDLGLPLAYFCHAQLVKPSDQAKTFIEETYSLLCAALSVDDQQDYDSLNDMFLAQNDQ